MTGSSSATTSVSSPLQHIRRKFQTGRTEAYDLVKVKILLKINTTNQNLRTLLILFLFNCFYFFNDTYTHIYTLHSAPIANRCSNFFYFIDFIFDFFI